MGSLLAGLLFLGLVTSTTGMVRAPQLQQAGREPSPFTADFYATPNQRVGVGLIPGVIITVDGEIRRAAITDYDVGPLHIGWYCNWNTAEDPPRPDGMRFVQLVRIRPSLYPTNTQEITAAVAANPGSLWIIGNEPEARYNQGNRTPATYAEIYHDLYMCIKGTPDVPGLDPTAWIAIGGVIQPTPLRLQWLDMVLEAYVSRYGDEMPVDVWNTHVQILQEKAATVSDPLPWGAAIPAGLDAPEGRLYTLLDNGDPAVFRQLVTEFRQWMKDRGFQDKPLIISEYGVIMPSSYIVEGGDPARGDRKVTEFMLETFDWLLTTHDADLGYPADGDRLVQQWMWFSLNSHYNGALFNNVDPKVITPFGRAFRGYMWKLLGLMRTISLPVVVRDAVGR